MLGYGSCYGDKIDRNFANNKLNYSFTNVADERYNSYHSLRDGNCRYPDFSNVSSFYNPTVLYDRNEKHDDLPVTNGNLGNHQSSAEKESLRNEFLKYGSRNTEKEIKIDPNLRNRRESMKRKHVEPSISSFDDLHLSVATIFKQFINEKGMICNNFDLSKSIIQPNLSDNSVIWEKELNTWRRNAKRSPIRICKDTAVHKYLFDNDMEILRKQNYPQNNSKSKSFSADMTRFVVGGTKTRLPNSTVSMSRTEIIDTPSVGADDCIQFGSVITKFNVFDYGHKKVDVDKLKIVDPHLPSVPCVNNNEHNKVVHIEASASVLGTDTVSDEHLHADTIDNCPPAIGVPDAISPSPLESPKDQTICDLRAKISTQLKSLAELVTSVPNAASAAVVVPEKEKSSNDNSILPTKSGWRLIPLVTPLRVIFSKANIDVLKCHKSDPRIMHLR